MASARPCATAADTDLNAWVTRLDIQGASSGPLSGLKFAVKDNFAIEGHTNGCGSPAWLSTHSEAAAAHAPCVQRLLDAGASFAGVTQMDELAYSLNGENAHYGTPVNVAAPDRVPGGSSSGSATVVAAGQVDFAIGSDTAGSVRVPASYQGIFGFRPTHGAVPMTQALPLAPSFDTCGWFARDAQTLQRVGQALLTGQSQPRSEPLQGWTVATDAFETAPEVANAVYEAMSVDFQAVQSVLGSPTEQALTEDEEKLTDWHTAFRNIQSSEVWKAHGEWIESNQPEFGPGIRERFDAASRVSLQDVTAGKNVRARVWRRLDSLIGSKGFITLPAAPGPAPMKNLPASELDSFRAKALALTSIAGLSGMPQVSIPCAAMEGLPVGLSIIAPRGKDIELLQLTVDLAGVLLPKS